MAPTLAAVITVQHALQTQLVLLWALKVIAAQPRLAPASTAAEVQGQALLQLPHLQHRRQASVIFVKLVHVRRVSLAFPSRLGPVLLAGPSRQTGARVCQTARRTVAGKLPSSFNCG